MTYEMTAEDIALLAAHDARMAETAEQLPEPAKRVEVQLTAQGRSDRSKVVFMRSADRLFDIAVFAEIGGARLVDLPYMTEYGDLPVEHIMIDGDTEIVINGETYKALANDYLLTRV